MDVRPAIEIDMTEYGGKGVTVVAPPGARARLNLTNEVAKRMRIDEDSGVRTGPAGDIEFLMLLSRVRSAPFEKDLESFLEYCDSLPDGGAAFVDALTEAVKKVDDPDSSPSHA